MHILDGTIYLLLFYFCFSFWFWLEFLLFLSLYWSFVDKWKKSLPYKNLASHLCMLKISNPSEISKRNWKVGRCIFAVFVQIYWYHPLLVSNWRPVKDTSALLNKFNFESFNMIMTMTVFSDIMYNILFSYITNFSTNVI